MYYTVSFLLRKGINVKTLSLLYIVILDAPNYVRRCFTIDFFFILVSLCVCMCFCISESTVVLSM